MRCSPKASNWSRESQISVMRRFPYDPKRTWCSMPSGYGHTPADSRRPATSSYFSLVTFVGLRRQRCSLWEPPWLDRTTLQRSGPDRDLPRLLGHTLDLLAAATVAWAGVGGACAASCAVGACDRDRARAAGALRGRRAGTPLSTGGRRPLRRGGRGQTANAMG
jgi:hypothetical protein